MTYRPIKWWHLYRLRSIRALASVFLLLIFVGIFFGVRYLMQPEPEWIWDYPVSIRISASHETMARQFDFVTISARGLPPLRIEKKNLRPVLHFDRLHDEPPPERSVKANVVFWSGTDHAAKQVDAILQNGRFDIEF